MERRFHRTFCGRPEGRKNVMKREGRGMIRKLEQADLEAVMEIWLSSNLEAHDFVPAEYWMEHYGQVKELLPKARCFVFEGESGRIEGFIGLTRNHVAGLFVKREARSKGTGRRLLSYAKGLCPELTLHVYEKNRRAVCFYLREGFEIHRTAAGEPACEREFLMAWHGEKGC